MPIKKVYCHLVEHQNAQPIYKVPIQFPIEFN